MEGEMWTLLDKFEAWEQETEVWNEYQNYKPSKAGSKATAGGRQRPGSAVNANSRLLRGT